MKTNRSQTDSVTLPTRQTYSQRSASLVPMRRRLFLHNLGDTLAKAIAVTSLVGTGTSGCIRFDDSYKYESVEYEELQGNLADYYGEKVVRSGIFLAGDFEAYVSFDGEIKEYENIWEMYPPESDPDEEDEYIPVINHHPKEGFLAETAIEIEIEAPVTKFYRDKKGHTFDYCLANFP